jgi:hypothetical protein
MKNWFRSRETTTVPDRPELIDAYKDGRKDEGRLGKRVVDDPRVDKANIKEAYGCGRRDERTRRRGSPLAAVLVTVVALAGAGVLYLAAREGSFTGGGKVVDANLSAASRTVQAPVRNAADNAGNALQDAGKNLKQTAGSDKH